MANGASGTANGEDGLARVYADLHLRACAAAGNQPDPASPGATIALGHRLLALHASVPRPWPIMRIDMIDPDFSARRPKLLLRPQPAWGTLRVDGETLIGGIPSVAWQHDVGGEPLLAWAIARAKAEAEAFAKDAFIDHLARLCRIAVETVAVVRTS
ncbi:type ISP restriction/modification enzyme [Chelatococcus reniformis]|nr:type ISP restriction/modification enzyme [Chelatococcus reniformis]